MHVMSSVKLLYGLYCEKKKVKDINGVLDNLMSKMKKGESNLII
jgi:transcription termination factor NusB